MNELFWLTLILFVVAAVLRSELFFYLLYVLLGLQVVARFWVYRSARRVQLRREAPVAAFPGEPFEVALQIRNTSLLPVPWLALHESVPVALRTPPAVREVVSLGVGEQRSVSYTVVGQQRGLYQLGPLTVRTGDVLGLGERALVAEGASALTIYPRVLALHELGLPANLPYGSLATPQRLFTDPARPVGIRPYQPSDGVRRIDWKSTAHAQQPLVRRYQPAIALEALVALAFSREEYSTRHTYDLMERAVTAAASIAVHLAEQAQPVGLFSNGLDAANGQPALPLPPATGRAHLMQALGILGRLQPAPDGRLETQLAHASARLSWGSTLIVVTGNREPEVLASVLPLKRRGLNIALVLLDPTPEELALPRSHGIAAYGIWRDGRPQAS